MPISRPEVWCLDQFKVFKGSKPKGCFNYRRQRKSAREAETCECFDVNRSISQIAEQTPSSADEKGL